MLIRSDRHTVKDLELWREYEEADRLRSGLEHRQQAAVNAIKEFAVRGPCYAGVSWGKDSVVLGHLIWLADADVPLVNLCCTNRNPDCDAVRDAFLSRFPMRYSEYPVDYGDLHAQRLPHQELDRLTDEQWNTAIRECGKPFAGRHILGIRGDESGGRLIRMFRWGVSSKNGCAPIGWWKTADVFGYLAIHDLPTHPAYAMLGGGRWPRDRLRTAEIGDTHGTGGGRAEWEREYYSDILRRLEV